MCGNLDDGLNLDRDIKGQFGHPHRGPRPPPGVAEHLHQQVGAAVDDRGSPVKPGRQLTIPKTFTTRRTRPRLPSSARSTARICRPLSRAASRAVSKLSPPFANPASDQTPVRTHRTGTGDEQEITSHNGRNVVPNRHHRCRQFDAQFTQPLIDILTVAFGEAGAGEVG